MSPICGILNRSGKDVSAQMCTMMTTLGQKEYAGAWLVADGAPQWWQEGSEPSTGMLLGQISFNTREQPLERPSFSCRGNLSVLYEGNLYNREELSAYIQSNHELAVDCAAEIVAHMLEENYRGDLATALKLVAPELDGAYCLVASDGKKVMIMKDMAGLRPVFYAQTDELIAFASTKRALWETGFTDVKPLRAGLLASLSKDGIICEDVCSLQKMRVEPKLYDMATVVDRYCNMLENSVRKRMRNSKKFGVLMSGGVDSCLIAKLVTDIAAESNVQVTAYTAGLESTADIKSAEKYALELGVNHRIRRLTLDEVESYIPQVAYAVEERDMVQIEAGIGIYAALEQASQDGIHEVFSGQGPDELWGGYTWYPDVIASEGYESLQEKMFDDLERGDIETLDRENKIAMALGSEQIFPYCDSEMVKLAMSVSPRLKVKSAEDRTGKHPHREAALRFGVPKEFAYRGKNAAQHGTGVHDALDIISRRNGFTSELVDRIGYNSKEVCLETLASSTRYGYRYAEKELWQTPEHVQFFLDVLAYKCDLLNEDERGKIEVFLKKAES